MLETKTVTNGPIAKQVLRVRHSTLPWLISVSLDPASALAHLDRPAYEREIEDDLDLISVEISAGDDHVSQNSVRRAHNRASEHLPLSGRFARGSHLPIRNRRVRAGI